jgi:hypothetical protein
MELTRDVTDESGGDDPADERTAHTLMRSFYAKMPRPFSGGALESKGGFYFSDDNYDFPPTVHPGCELFIAGLFILVILTFCRVGRVERGLVDADCAIMSGGLARPIGAPDNLKSKGLRS